MMMSISSHLSFTVIWYLQENKGNAPKGFFAESVGSFSAHSDEPN